MRPCASITLTAGFTYLPSAQVLCHVVPMIMAVSVYVSTLTSMAIAVDRYFAIVHPLRARLALHAPRFTLHAPAQARALRARLTSRGCLLVIGDLHPPPTSKTRFLGLVPRVCPTNRPRIGSTVSATQRSEVPGERREVCWCRSAIYTHRLRLRHASLGLFRDSAFRTGSGSVQPLLLHGAPKCPPDQGTWDVCSNRSDGDRRSMSTPYGT